MTFAELATARIIEKHSEGRGDELLLHIGGDIAGMCNRKSWARRSGLPMAPPDATTAMGFEVGHAMEAALMAALFEALPPHLRIETNVLCWIGVLDGIMVGGMGTEPTGNIPHAVGHIDALITEDGKAEHVLDTKTTVYSATFKDGRKVFRPYGDGPHLGQQLQVAAYAIAAGAPKASLLTLDLGGKSLTQFDVDVEEMRPIVRDRLVECLHVIDPTVSMPPALPEAWTTRKNGETWACTYCDFIACERNTRA